MTISHFDLNDLMFNSPQECISWVFKWNNIKGGKIPNKKLKQVYHDLIGLNMGYNIRHDKDNRSTQEIHPA